MLLGYIGYLDCSQKVKQCGKYTVLDLLQPAGDDIISGVGGVGIQKKMTSSLSELGDNVTVG